MKRLLFIFALGILLISMAHAEVITDIPTKLEFEQNQIDDLRVPCFNNGSYCSSTASCTITINYKGISIAKNATMDNQGQYFNYTLTKTRTFKTGDYDTSVVCYDGAAGSGASTFTYLVTPSGNDDSGLNQLILIGTALLFSIGFIWLGFYKNDPYIVEFAGIALLLLGIYVMNNGIGNYRNAITLTVSVVAIGVAAYISTKTGIEIIQENMN